MGLSTKRPVGVATVVLPLLGSSVCGRWCLCCAHAYQPGRRFTAARQGVGGERGCCCSPLMPCRLSRDLPVPSAHASPVVCAWRTDKQMVSSGRGGRATTESESDTFSSPRDEMELLMIVPPVALLIIVPPVALKL